MDESVKSECFLLFFFFNDALLKSRQTRENESFLPFLVSSPFLIYFEEINKELSRNNREREENCFTASHLNRICRARREREREDEREGWGVALL